MEFDDEECELVLFTLPISNSQILTDPMDITQANTTYILPQCVYFEWDKQTWSREGCWIINYTLNETQCACNHIGSTLTLQSDEFVPNVFIITTTDTPFSWTLFLEDPTCWMFVACLITLLGLSLLCVPTQNSIPLVARSNIIWKSERDAMLSTSWIGAVIKIFQQRTKTKCCRLYALNLRNQHSLCSICCGMEGLNISPTDLILILLIYVVTVMVCMHLLLKCHFG